MRERLAAAPVEHAPRAGRAGDGTAVGGTDARPQRALPPLPPLPASAEAPGRIVIVDASLLDRAGHHLSYDAALAGAARDAGLETVILAHRDAAPIVHDLPGLQPTFSADMWVEKLAPADPAIARSLARHRRLALPLAFWRRKRQRGPPLRPAAPWPAPRWAGMGALPRLLVRQPAFLLELEAALGKLSSAGQSATRVFCHMVNDRNLLEWAVHLSGRGAVPPSRTVLLFRYPARYLKPERLQTRLAVALLRRAHDAGTVRFASDSARLAAEHATCFDRPFEVLPIPHAAPASLKAATALARPEVEGLVSFGFLGNPRAEKGFIELAEAVLALGSSEEGRRLAFTIQVSDAAPECRAAVEALRRAALPRVTLVELPLPIPDYRAKLDAQDAIIVAYRPEPYAARSSGVLVEAIAAGKPVITTAGTWMADELKRWGAGLTIVRPSGDALAAAILRVAAELPSLRADAAAGADACRRHHAAASLLARILDG